MTRKEILEIQRQLKADGFPHLKVDGIYGPATADAYQAWLNQSTPDTMTTPAPAPAKPWWQSRAILGLLASVLAMLAGRFGLEIDDATITPILLQVVELGGLIIAAWGTITRKAPIDQTLVARISGQSLRLPGANRVPTDGQADRSVGPFGY